MKIAYPIVLTPAHEGGYVVYIPDFNINTQGDNTDDAVYMARDAIYTAACYLQDENINLPAPSSIENIKINADETKLLVDVDLRTPLSENSATA